VLRGVWWVIALAFFIYLILARSASIASSNPTIFDTGVLAIVAVLILLPFMSEISAFGFTVKKQIEEAKKELKQNVREEIGLVRNELLALSISNRLTSNVILQAGVPNPPPDSALEEVRNQITEVLEQFQQERGIRDVQPRRSEVAENTVSAFEQRYLVEQEVKRLWRARIADGEFHRYPPFSRMVDDLVQYELITPSLGKSLREVYSVASAVVHGDDPSDEKTSFLFSSSQVRSTTSTLVP
jgi:hypothetical protein